MAQKKSGWMPKFEIVIIAVFFFSFIIWAVSQCSSSNDTADADAPTSADSEVTISGTPEDIAEVVTTDDVERQDTVYVVRRDTVGRTYGRLYITINNLKMRELPGLKSEVLAELPLFSEVAFLDAVTDSTYQINLGYEYADEPYVKVRTADGKVGWVYGAGVNYYKKKRGGVLE